MRAPRKSAPAVKNGRVQKKNNWEATPNQYRHARPFPVINRERPGAGYRHLLLRRDIEAFIELLPDWAEVSRGLNAIVLAWGEDDREGWHRPGIVAVGAWPVGIWNLYTSHGYRSRQGILRRLDVPVTWKDDIATCQFTEQTAKAYQLLDVLLHELGHHHDRMTTRSERDCARGEPFAEAYAQKHEALIWDRYTRAFKL